jgi:hypothetical protein
MEEAKFSKTIVIVLQYSIDLESNNSRRLFKFFLLSGQMFSTPRTNLAIPAMVNVVDFIHRILRQSCILSNPLTTASVPDLAATWKEPFSIDHSTGHCEVRNQ